MSSYQKLKRQLEKAKADLRELTVNPESETARHIRNREAFVHRLYSCIARGTVKGTKAEFEELLQQIA